MTDPAEQAAPQPEIERPVAAPDEEFTVDLPTSRGDTVRHVACLRGDQIEFTDAYDTFVRQASEESAPLFVPAEQRDLVSVSEVLNSLGGAKVERFEAMPI